MSSLNSVTVLGNLTRDVEIKQLPSGTSVAEIGLAVNERIKRGEEWVDDVIFLDIVCWGRTAEIAAQYLTKGSKAAFTGKLKQDKWEDKNGGGKRSKLKITADRLVLLGGKGEDQPTQGNPNVGGARPSTTAPITNPNEIPF